MKTLLLAGIVVLLSGCGQEPVGSDFATLARADEDYAQARPGATLTFPRDHGAHPAYRIEWWYLTANLQDDSGRPWGLQWTLFRTAARPPAAGAPASGQESDSDNPWQDEQVFMAHFAVSAPGEHRAFQRYARGGDHEGLSQAGVVPLPFAAWLDDWRLESLGETWLPLRLRAAQAGVAADLRLQSDRPPVLQGDRGFSQKHPGGGGSWYYSQPWLQASGTVTFAGETVNVRGQAWLDREWSSQFLQPDQLGWDWFALHLEGGEKLMAFQLRSVDGPPYVHAVRLLPDGGRRVAAPGDFRLEAVRHVSLAGRRLPLGWRLSWPGEGLELEVQAGLEEQWMDVDFPYWEGRVVVRDDDGEPAGEGYMELTGYGDGPSP